MFLLSQQFQRGHLQAGRRHSTAFAAGRHGRPTMASTGAGGAPAAASMHSTLFSLTELPDGPPGPERAHESKTRDRAAPAPAPAEKAPEKDFAMDIVMLLDTQEVFALQK